jgi:hypothetical protein
MKKRVIASVFVIAFTNTALAEYSLYDGDRGALSIALELRQAAFSEVNNQSGSPAKDTLSDLFWDMSITSQLIGSLNLPHESKLYGGFSYVYSSTLGHDPSGYTQKNSEMYQQENDYTVLSRYDDYRYKNKTEELFLGWKSGKLFDEDEKITLDLSGGKQNYKLGSGFLLNYGADNGGNRGAGWVNPRTAFNNTLLGRFNFDAIKLEGFYLETRPLNFADKRNYRGANLEYAYSDTTHFALSYIKTGNKRFLHDDGSIDLFGQQVLDNDTYNARVEFSPLENFTISSEYAYQINSTKITTAEAIDKTKVHASGGFGQIEYKREDLFWQPTISYRYAAQSENFDGMSPGFGEWATWFQGEISGEWVLFNTNLITHVGRLVLKPEESVTLTLIYLNYTFVNPAKFELSSANYGNEVNVLTEWNCNDSLNFALGLEAFVPGEAGKEYLGGGNKMWFQGMVYAAYEF